MLLDPTQARKGSADHARGIMVAIAGKITDCDYCVGYRRLDQAFDLAGRHRHQRLLLSMICRRASISLLRSASATLSSSQSTPAEVRSPSTLRTTSWSPASSKSDRTTSLA